MSKTIQFCISCAREFHPASPDVVLCPDCGGPPEADSLESVSAGRTLLNADTPPPDSSRTLLEPQPAQPPSIETTLELSPGRSFAEGDVPAEWQPGDTLLDTYTVSGLLGEGGMGKVYRVHHKSWNIDLAVKSPHPEFFQTQEQCDLFISEAETWVNLGLHPHIVSCYYVRTLGGIPRVFAELVEGGSLADWIEQRKITSVEQALDIAIQFAWGLAYAHEQGLVHRDVKPANVLITPDGTAKVTDFGLAKAGKGMTPAYASPEQAEAQLKNVELTLQSDIWSWALSVLEMFAGRPFWARAEMPDYAWGQTALQALEHYLSGELEDAAISEMPAGLADLLKECFQKDPAVRPASMDVIAERLIKMYAAETGQPYPREKPSAVDLRADSLNNKALSLLDLGKWDLAQNLFQEALAKDGVHPEATYNLSLTQWWRGIIDDLEVVHRLERLLASHPTKWPIAYMLGLIHIERGHLEGALEYLREVKDQAEAQQIINFIHKLLPETIVVRQLEDFYPKQLPSKWGANIYLTLDGSQLLWFSPAELFEDTQLMHLLKIENATYLHKSINKHTSVSRLPVFFSPDGCYVISSTDNGKTLLIWEINTGVCLHTLIGHEESVHDVNFSPNGRNILSGSDDKTLKLWNLEKGICLRTFDAKQSDQFGVKHVVFSPNGRRALSGSGMISQNYFTLHLWDIETGACLSTFMGSKHFVTSAVFSPDGCFFVSIHDDYTMQIWDLETAECLHTCAGHKSYITSVAISPNGLFALTGSADKTLKLWDTTSGICLHTFTGHESAVTSVEISPDGKMALSGSSGETLRLWDLSDGKCLRVFKGHKHEVEFGVFTPDGKMVISHFYNEMIRLWRLSTGQCLSTFETKSPEMIFNALSKNKRFVLSINNQSTLRRWDLSTLGSYQAPYRLAVPIASATATENQQTFTRQIEQANQALNKQDISRAVNLARQIRSLPGFENSREIMSIWSDLYRHCRLGSLLGIKRKKNLQGHTRDISSVAISLDSLFAISGSYDKTLKLWGLNEGICLQTLTGHKTIVTSVTFSPDGKYILSGGLSLDEDDNLTGDSLRLWETKSGACMCIFNGVINDVNSVAFSPDGQFILSGGGSGGGSVSGVVQLWSINSGACIRTNRLEFVKGGGLVTITRSIAFTPDGSKYVTGSDDHILRVWDMASGECLQCFTGHSQTINSVAISPDGKRILSGGGVSGYGCELRLWDVATGKCLRVFNGHESVVHCVGFSSNGHYAFSGSGHSQQTDFSFRVWEVDTGVCICIINMDKRTIHSLALSSDGRSLLLGDEEHATLWNLDWELNDYKPTDWDENTRPYLQQFLTLHTPYAAVFPQDRQPTKEEVTLALTRQGKPYWREADFQQLLHILGCAGFGWLRPEGVRRKLEEMAHERG